MKVLLCPGQGAQYPGMGRAVAEQWPEARAIFDRADEALGTDLSRVMFEGAAEDVERTDVCQPAILTLTAAIWEVLCTRGAAAPANLAYALGLSLGEYTAHYVAGTLSFEDAVRLVGRRGRYMQEASDATPSGMAAVMGLALDEIEQITAGVRAEGGVVVVANLNAPGQVVVSGENGALALAGERLQAAGAKRFIPLKVAGAFHSPVMHPAADRLADDLSQVDFATPRIPVVSNVTAGPVTSADEARQTLARQVVSPVLFERSLRHVINDVGSDAAFVEPGPGKALTGFMRKIDRAICVQNLDSADDLAAVLAG